MVALKDNLLRMLESKDFSVHEKDVYLYGRRQDVSVVIMVSSEPGMEDVRSFLKDVSGFSGRKVVASLSQADEGTLAYLQENGIYYWGRDDIEHELGSMQLESVAPTHRSLVDEVIQDDLPQKPGEPHEAAIPVIVESSTENAEKIIKPNVSLEDVKHLASHDIKGHKFELELVPHYLFHFVITPGGGAQKAGMVAVNALTKHVETWRWGFELVDTVDLPYSKREPKMDYDEARKLAQSVIDREYKSHTQVIRDYGHSEIIESKRPEKNEVLIESKGLVYLPVWCVEGLLGAMIVNSSTGKIISEHLHAGAEASETRLG